MKRFFRQTLPIMLLCCAGVVGAQQAPLNSAIERRVDALLQQMTLEEKVGQMTQLTLQSVTKRTGTATVRMQLDSVKLEHALVGKHVGALLNVFDVAMTPEEWSETINTIQRFAKRDRLKVPVIYGIDAVHGFHYQTTSTLFPQNIALAATWNPSLVRRANEITAYETRASGITWNFSPVLDLGRQPLWPRFYETFGEDPYLASVLGAEAVLGNQRDPWASLAPLLPGHGSHAPMKSAVFVAATAKHFLGYPMPLSGMDRTTAWIPVRQLREYFLPSFRAAVNAGIRTVMVNSADINGIPVHSDHAILTDLLRTELGFTGITDTDWEDVGHLRTVHRVAATNKDATRMAVLAGIDMCMVPYDFSFTDDLIALVKEHAVPQSRIDEAVRRILRVKMELGLFENALPDASMMADIGAPAFKSVSRAAAEEAVTLLKNDGVLPLAKTTRVLVTGPAADALTSQYGGWSYTWQGNNAAMYPKNVNTLLAAVRNQVGVDHVIYVAGSTFRDTLDLVGAVAAARSVDVAIVAVGEDAYAETPGNIDDLALSSAQIRLARAIEATGTPVVIAMFHGRPRVVREIVDGARAVVSGHETGPYGGDAVAAVLFGDVNPSGRLPFSWPRSSGAIEAYDHTGGIDTASTRAAYNPEWPFGFGLSYTSFAYSDLRVTMPVVGPRDSVRLSVTVTNTGKRAGKEVVQLYVRQLVASVTPPVKRLRRFEKISLDAGAARTVTFAVAAAELSFVGRDNKLVLEPGSFDAMIGNLSARFAISTKR